MKLLKMLLPVIILALSLSGCATKRTDISMEEIIEAYEEAGYSVWSRECDEPSDYGAIAYIQADHPDGGYIYFTIFETSQQAKAYKKEFYHPGMMGLFSVIFGDPT